MSTQTIASHTVTPGHHGLSKTANELATLRSSFGRRFVDAPLPGTLTANGELIVRCYEDGYSYGSSGRRVCFVIARRSMNTAAMAGLRAEGRDAYLSGVRDGAVACRPTRRRVDEFGAK